MSTRENIRLIARAPLLISQTKYVVGTQNHPKTCLVLWIRKKDDFTILSASTYNKYKNINQRNTF